MAFSQISVADRPGKPRTQGLTMVVDKGLGITAVRDFIATAAPYVDIVKLGWGTSRLYATDVLRTKIGLLQAAGMQVCPGGTLLEIAFAQQCVPAFLAEARALGFDSIEVSNGICPLLDVQAKQDVIAQAAEAGFRVYSEVGRKLIEEDRTLSAQARAEEANADLAAGATKVIMEARESGSRGIFRTDGTVNHDLALQLFSQINPADIMWEAPSKSQQEWLLRHLGPAANLGNIAPDEALSVETLRLGLRADTMRDHFMNAVPVHFELGVSGAVRARERGDVVVVIDALRATSTIVEACNGQASSVVPVASVEELQRCSQLGDVTVGERGGRKIEGVDFTNSPVALASADLVDRRVLVSSSNGTECIQAAKGPDNVVLIGALTNCSAVAAAVQHVSEQTGKAITLLMAGRNNADAIEDRIAATHIARQLGAVTIRGVLQPYDSLDTESDFLASDSGKNLVELGQRHDVIWCAMTDSTTVVPVFDGSGIRPLSVSTELSKVSA